MGIFLWVKKKYEVFLTLRDSQKQAKNECQNQTFVKKKKISN
jgi:hypothetical protein